MLANGMRQMGHEVDVWQPLPLLYNLKGPKSIKKWFGYLDQFLIFPLQIQRRKNLLPPDTLFVFTDNALGPWVPLLMNRPHIIHCHDFIAQRSALGEFPENRISLTGRLYQSFIRRGYRKAKNFISVSYKTRDDLHKFITNVPSISEVVYNGINKCLKKIDHLNAREILRQQTGIDLSNGYILHVGGNQWYKNRIGVIEIYNATRRQFQSSLSLLLIGVEPSDDIREVYNLSPFKKQIHFLANIDDGFLRIAYAGASAFLFPSIAEGFGWPIAEAMASGCPVITTNENPMKEVAGSCAFFIPAKPNNGKEAVNEWAFESAKVVVQVLQLTDSKRMQIVQNGLININRFNAESMISQVEKIYSNLLNIKTSP